MLDAPKTDKPHSELRICASLPIGVTGMQGWRCEMEDAHICLEMPSKLDNVLVGVFDGHGGAGAAIWIERNLVSFIERTSEWKDYLAQGVENPDLVGKALTRAFLDADEALRAFQEGAAESYRDARHITQSQRENGVDTSGCTSVVCVITPKYIICANAGDSRCVLATNGTVKAMSFDHKPYDDLEMRRIVAAGGHVSMKRVDGDLAVSRALGDFQFKDNVSLPAVEQKVSPEPDIIISERSTVDEFLLIACDGLWDVMSNEDASEFGRALFKLGERNMMLFAEEMIDGALAKGSRDNISAVAVRLDGASISAGNGVAGLRIERARIAAEDAALRDQKANQNSR
jgi:serine/threonine protein phosphatase PrpC